MTDVGTDDGTVVVIVASVAPAKARSRLLLTRLPTLLHNTAFVFLVSDKNCAHLHYKRNVTYVKFKFDTD